MIGKVFTDVLDHKRVLLSAMANIRIYFKY